MEMFIIFDVDNHLSSHIECDYGSNRRQGHVKLRVGRDQINVIWNGSEEAGLVGAWLKSAGESILDYYRVEPAEAELVPEVDSLAVLADDGCPHAD